MVFSNSIRYNTCTECLVLENMCIIDKVDMLIWAFQFANRGEITMIMYYGTFIL